MTLAEFRIHYPQFDSVDDLVVQRYLDMFRCQFTGDYGCMSDELQGLFVAHKISIWQRTSSGSAAPVVTATSKSVGDESMGGYVSGSSETGHGDYGSTAYGIQFWNTIKLYGMGGLMAEPHNA